MFIILCRNITVKFIPINLGWWWNQNQLLSIWFMCPSNAQAWSEVQASDVPPFFDFISSWCSWRKSTTLPLKCFQTKPIKRIMQIIWKCAPLTVWTATDNQTIALWCLVLFCALQLYGCSVSGGFFWKQIDMIHIQTVFFCFFSSCLSQKKEGVWVQRWLVHLSL